MLCEQSKSKTTRKSERKSRGYERFTDSLMLRAGGPGGNDLRSSSVASCAPPTFQIDEVRHVALRSHRGVVVNCRLTPVRLLIKHDSTAPVARSVVSRFPPSANTGKRVQLFRFRQQVARLFWRSWFTLRGLLMSRWAVPRGCWLACRHCPVCAADRTAQRKLRCTSTVSASCNNSAFIRRGPNRVRVAPWSGS